MSNSEYDRLKAQKDAIEIRQDYQKHGPCRAAYANLEAELKAAKENFQNACRVITEMETRDPYKRIAELEATVNELNSFDAPAELVTTRRQLAERDTIIAELEARDASDWHAVTSELAASQAREKELRDRLEVDWQEYP